MLARLPFRGNTPCRPPPSMPEIRPPADQRQFPIFAAIRGTGTPASPPMVKRNRLQTPNRPRFRSEEHTSELQSLMRISYAVFCLKKKIPDSKHTNKPHS